MLSATPPAEQTMKMISINEFAFLNGTPATMSRRKTRSNSAETAVEKRHKNLDISFFPEHKL